MLSKSRKISILMPVKNAGSFLQPCIQSILHQNYADWELLAVDDHSSDQSLEILKSASANEDRIKIFRNEGHGIISALRLAYKKSTGQYITRMDSDDLMAPNKLEQLSNKLQINGPGHVALGLVHYFSEEQLGNGYIKYEQWLNELTSKGNNWNEIYKECVIPSPCWMLHRSDLDLCGAFHSDYYPEDYDLCFRMYQSGLKCIPSIEILHQWRDYSSRTSRNDPNYADNIFIDIKCKYFLDLHHMTDRSLLLWGAGNKSKRIAKILNKQKIDFIWMCNNPNKIGQEIYGKILKDDQCFLDYLDAQIIIAVSAPDDQHHIKDQLSTAKKKNMEDYFFFC